VKAETPGAKASAPAPAPAPAPKMEEKKMEKMEEKKEEKKAEKKELPKTGGSTASLLALGAGTLLVAGGLLARRMVK
ncbi:MAG: LPXTG cell wall anchor domain-containing protein, partial [Actinomycetota bacterium]|nr:LPXTG cell wall anchor domain-containing protein [Actinomycetota bacterium]